MKEQFPSIPMERSGKKILRRSIFTFLKKYQYFTTTSVLLAFPFSAAILLSQALLPFSPLLPTIHNRLGSLFHAAAAEFPPSHFFFTILHLKLSQTIVSSILALPFTLSFLLMAKASIVQALNNHHKPPSFSSFLSIYNHILLTQFCNFFVILSANATCFSLLFIAFNCLEGLGYSSNSLLLLLFLSATGAIVYSIVLANALIVCNLASVSSGMDRCGGYLSILKACILIRGRTATALALALPGSMALAAVEALFQYRVVRAYYAAKSSTSSMALEWILIAYLYSIIVVIDIIVSCVFFQSCQTACQIDLEERYAYRIEIERRDISLNAEYVKNLKELP